MSNFKTRITQLWEEAKDRNYRTTQEQFAAQFGATKNQLKGWLRGSGEPDTELIKKIAKVSNVSVDWLVGNSEIRTIAGLKDSYDEKLRSLSPEIRQALVLIINLCSQHGKPAQR
jgi:transcriptional regulator with XRE-family HTH domain